jgi:hypothetical protein
MQETYESGERFPSALCWCAEPSLEVGEALSATSLEEDLELGVTCGEEVSGAMGGYVLVLLPSCVGAWGAGTGGATTAVVIAFEWCGSLSTSGIR